MVNILHSVGPRGSSEFCMETALHVFCDSPLNGDCLSSSTGAS